MRPNQPLVGISWYEAMAFCRWLTQMLNDGWIYGLPSELEWEYAARGTERRMYPWGSNQEPTAEHANYDEQHNGTSTVGCFAPGATPQGLLDMAGNVWEWTRSDYRPYPYDPGDGREDGSEPSRKRFTLRGGGWVNPAPYMRASCRLYDTPNTHSFNVGMRLVRHRR
jgi:formylglycine-generating enzyme required for sulfatase activity